MVELGDAAVADGAVLGADWLPDLGRTRGARGESVNRSERRSEHVNRRERRCENETRTAIMSESEQE